MKVKELIKYLESFNPDVEVGVSDLRGRKYQTVLGVCGVQIGTKGYISKFVEPNEKHDIVILDY